MTPCHRDIAGSSNIMVHQADISKVLLCLHSKQLLLLRTTRPVSGS